MLALLHESPLLLLFLVAALGYLVGRIRVAGFGLGVAAVLFAGLAISSRDPELKLPELVGSFGLVLFVYTIGIAGGPGFFASFRRRGLAENGLALGLLTFAAALAASLRWLLHLDGPLIAGTFAGALTNTDQVTAVHTGHGIILVAPPEDVELMHLLVRLPERVPEPQLAALNLEVADPDRTAAGATRSAA